VSADQPSLAVDALVAGPLLGSRLHPATACVAPSRVPRAVVPVPGGGTTTSWGSCQDPCPLLAGETQFQQAPKVQARQSGLHPGIVLDRSAASQAPIAPAQPGNGSFNQRQVGPVLMS
jgi:hypothetical protein